MRKVFVLAFVLVSFGSFAHTCLVTEIRWHINTAEGLTVGVTRVVFACEDNGGGGSGTSEPGGPTGGDPPPEPELPCKWPNASACVTNLRHVVPTCTEILPYGPDSTRVSGHHDGVDLIVESGEPVYAPCDGELIISSENVARNDRGMGRQGNDCTILVSGSFGAPPKGGSSSQIVNGSIIKVTMSHLDFNWATNAGVINHQPVHKGQKIGFTDNTGSIQDLGAHLHLQYTAIVDGKEVIVDPQEVADCGRN